MSKKITSSPYFSLILALLLSMLIPVLFVHNHAWRIMLLCIPACLHVLHIAQISHNTGKGEFAYKIKEEDAEKTLFICHNISYEIIAFYLIIPISVQFLISIFPKTIMNFLYDTSLGMLILEMIYMACVYLLCFYTYSKKEFTIDAKEIKYKRSFGILKFNRTFIINEDCFAFNISFIEQSLFFILIDHSCTRIKRFDLNNIDQKTVLDFFQPYLPYKPTTS